MARKKLVEYMVKLWKEKGPLPVMQAQNFLSEKLKFSPTRGEMAMFLKKSKLFHVIEEHPNNGKHGTVWDLVENYEELAVAEGLH